MDFSSLPTTRQSPQAQGKKTHAHTAADTCLDADTNMDYREEGEVNLDYSLYQGEDGAYYTRDSNGQWILAESPSDTSADFVSLWREGGREGGG